MTSGKMDCIFMSENNKEGERFIKMDIVTHTVTGALVGSCMAGYTVKGWKEKVGIVAAGALGGMLPDVDAVSMWSRFDGTLGRLFGLEEPGRVIYSGKWWYSHHGFMHSLLAAFLFAFLLGFCLWMLHDWKKYSLGLWDSLQKRRWWMLALTGGFVCHLVEDMVTPASVWGGVRLFFPSEVYIGGTGNIWWWNNYDIFLLVTVAFVSNVILLILSSFLKKRILRWFWCTFLLAVIAVGYQIKSRSFDFNASRFEVCENKSKEIQRNVLPLGVYRMMEKWDNWLIVHF